jgi:hypothetical protein
VIIEDGMHRAAADREPPAVGLRACWSQPVLAASGAVGHLALYTASRANRAGQPRRVEAGNLAAVAIETT